MSLEEHIKVAKGVYVDNLRHIGSCIDCINNFPIIHTLQVLLLIAEDTDEGATSVYDTSVQCSIAGP